MGLSDPPDPQDEATYAASKIEWARMGQPGHETMLSLVPRSQLLSEGRIRRLSNGRKILLRVSSSEAPRWLSSSVETKGAMRWPSS